MYDHERILEKQVENINNTAHDSFRMR
jgi:hypothetical protein